MDYMLLKLQGTTKIDGQSTLDGYTSCIEVMSFSHGVSNPIQMTTSNNGRTVGRPYIQEMTVSKVMDKATPHLNYYCAKGTNLGDTQLYLVRQDGNENVVYMTYEMTDTMLSSVSVGGGGGLPMETISLNFSKITWTYEPQKPETNKDGKVVHSWDQASNTGS